MVGLFPNDLPGEQEAIRAKCFHPLGTIVEFSREDIEKSIPARFEQQVACHPDRLAVVSQQFQVTYIELNQISNRIARAIMEHVGNGEEPIALLLEHGADLIAAIMGILKAGKIYVSVDPAFPDTRAAYMLGDSGAKLLVTNKQNLSQAQRLTQTQGGQEILNCDDIDPSTDSENLGLPISPDTRALILYTSGSTGNPKGVLHNHRNILVETKTYTNDVRICPEDRLALCQSCSFALSIRNLYGALLNGATLFLYDLAREGVASLAGWLHTKQITMLHLPATTFRGFLNDVAVDAMFPALRVLRLGAEPINSEDILLFQRHFASHCVLLHAIGPSETGTIRRYFISRDWCCSDTKVPVGYVVPDKEVFLLDETGQEVGANQIGEIVVRSKHLALGYWRRPDLTQAAFKPDPLGGGKRIYRTGDLGMMRPDGCLIHMGRKDFQVKIRGYRVEVGEIEEALLRIESVKAAIVHPQANSVGEQRLVAYVVPAAARVPTVSELRRALVQTLPSYMIPSVFVFLQTLPLLPNGKIDRKALTAPTQTRPVLDIAYVAPRTPIESELARIWGKILLIDRVGVDDNFFELGGHSLAATRIISQIIKKFQLELPLQALFQSPTVAEMAAVIAQHQANKADEYDLERILAELESMSEEQAQESVTAKAVGDGAGTHR
jgi:amino acid adenylation domain-containing protein